jgi:hypothetical protein
MMKDLIDRAASDLINSQYAIALTGAGLPIRRRRLKLMKDMAFS